MKRIYKNLMGAAALLWALGGYAETTLCQFEETDYNAISTYDYWDKSPFNTGELPGQIAVVDNPYSDEINGSGKVLAFQRSRYGSHLYGARIDLKTPITLSPTPQYIHVLMYKPVSGRVALVGLGKRNDWADQPATTVQFVTPATKELDANKWVDAVFSVYGNDAAELHSLVIVPDVDSHLATETDYVAYFDEIMINDEAQQRFTFDPYPLNFEATQKESRTDRNLDSISVSGNMGAMYRSNLSDVSTVYADKTSADPILLKVGESVTVSFGYKGDWMHRYVYLDKGNDGRFDVDIQDNVPTANSDLVAYSYLSGYTSTGTSASNDTKNNPPAFTIAPDMTPGFYRIRCKVDWDSSVAAGNPNSDNSIVANGGAIVDYLANVHRDNVALNVVARMCEVTAADGSTLPAEIPFGEAFSFNIDMDNDYNITGLEIKHGYNHEGEEYVFGNRQWKVDNVTLEEDGLITIPAEYIDGDIAITILFENKPTSIQEAEEVDGLRVIAGENQIELLSNEEVDYSVVHVNGACYATGRFAGREVISLPAGVYFVNGQKCIVR